MTACEMRRPGIRNTEGTNTGLKYNSKPSWLNPGCLLDHSTTAVRKQRLPDDNGRQEPGLDAAAQEAEYGRQVPTLCVQTLDGKQVFRHALPWHSGESPETQKAGLQSEWCIVCGLSCPRMKDHEQSSGQWKVTTAKCSLCTKPVCIGCKMPNNQCDRSRFQWFCRRCWTDVGHCDHCNLMLSEAKCNMIL